MLSNIKIEKAFTPSRQDRESGVIAEEKVLQLYYQNPTFGFYLVKLVTHRLLEDYFKSRPAGVNSAQC